MSFSIDPIATLFGFIAVYIATLAYRSTCKIWLQLLEVTSASTRSVNFPEQDFFNHFDITIRNLGIPLHEVKVTLCFTDADGGTGEFGLVRVEYRDRHKEVDHDAPLQQGCIGSYSLRSFDLARHGEFGFKKLANLDDIRKRNTRLLIYSQDYLVCEFRLWHRLYGVKSKWNSLAHWLNGKFDREITLSDGRSVLREGKVLPLFDTSSQFRLEYFVRNTVAAYERQHQSSEQDNENSSQC